MKAPPNPLTSLTPNWWMGGVDQAKPPNWFWLQITGLYLLLLNLNRSETCWKDCVATRRTHQMVAPFHSTGLPASLFMGMNVGENMPWAVRFCTVGASHGNYVVLSVVRLHL